MRMIKITPLRTLIALVFLAALLLAAGCIEPGYQPNNDIVVIKLSPNGSLEWSKIIDKGGNDQADIIIPTSDGGSLISANYDCLIQLSGNGTVLWEKNYRDPLCMASALTMLQEGSFIVGSSGNGVVCKIDKDGNLLWNKSSVKFDSEMTSRIHSIIETNDGGFLVAGNYLTLLDPEGRPLWQHSYDTRDGMPGYQGIFSVAEKKNGGFFGLARKYGELFLLHFDKNGVIIGNSSLNVSDMSSGLIGGDKGYSLLLFNTTNSSVEMIGLNPDGIVTRRKTLFDATAQRVLSQNPIIITNDGGIFSAIIRNPDATTDVLAEKGKIGVGGSKLNSEGMIEWSNISLTLCKPQKTTTNVKLNNVIQTSDGGFVILGLRDNFWKC